MPTNHKTNFLSGVKAFDFHSNQTKGILLMVFVTLLFATQDVVTKHLAQSVPILQFTGIRYLVFVVFAAWLVTRKQTLRSALQVDKPWLQVARGVLLLLQVMSFAWIVRNLGIAEMQSISMVYPLIVTALSPIVLGDQVGWRRWLAVGAGFIGSIIIISPTSVSFNFYSVLALGTAASFAIYSLMTRIAGRTDSAESSLLYLALAGVVLCSPLLPWIWQPIAPEYWAFIIALCVISIAGHYCMIRALQLTAPVILQPFFYLILLWSIILGYIFFDEVIATHKWYGIVLIVGAGLFVALRQQKLSPVQEKT